MSTLRSTQINNTNALAVVLEDSSGYPAGDPRSAPIRTDATSLLAAILEELRLIRLTLADIGDTESSDVLTDEAGE